MPFINTRASCPITAQQELQLKTELGKAIGKIGKPESWLMLGFEGESHLWFRGANDKPLAYIEVSLLGKATRSQYDDMTAAVTKCVSDVLGIDASGIYVKYEECGTWGYAGSNF